MHHVFSHENPRIDLFYDFLTPSLCHAVIESAAVLMGRSTVVDSETGVNRLDSCRTSETACLPASWLWLSHTIARTLGLDPASCETPQVQRYREGGEYVPHHDFFIGPSVEHEKSRGGQRIATAILYLNTVPSGGFTEFPELGITVRPVEGSLLTFGYGAGGGDPRLLHAGRPVVCGQKWILTQWFREGIYR